jgi:hypothetical protein
MARKKKEIFDAVKNVPRRNAIKRNGKGGRRGPGGGDPDITHYPGDPNIADQSGQQQWGPGIQSGQAVFADYIGWGAPGSTFSGHLSDINNLAGLYDWWQENQNAGWTGLGMGGFSGYDSFYDWYSQLGYGTANVPTNPLYGMHDLTNPEYGGTADAADYGGLGGTQGGPGDLGTGSYFAGGGLGSSMFGEGLWEQECSQIGPQFNSAGECIACCGEQYAGTGFYGDPDYVAPEGETHEIDPDAGGECLDMYTAAGGASSGMDYDTFEGLYC